MTATSIISSNNSNSSLNYKSNNSLKYDHHHHESIKDPSSTAASVRYTKINMRHVMTMFLIVALAGSYSFVFNATRAFSVSSWGETQGIAHSSSAKASKLKIAVISGFVSRGGETQGTGSPHISDGLMDHMLNKACYCDLWGYDYIFNTTWGFDQDVGNKFWLEFGTWHRVPHMIAALPHYDWILYTDTDYIFQDMSIPLESFIKKWELYGKEVSVFLPLDFEGYFTFSAFAVMIRNSPFGRRLLQNWMEFAQGLCPNGNFPGTPGRYGWELSDQPGIWYALAKTHSEFHNNSWETRCNATTGTIETTRFLGPELNEYFWNQVEGVHGYDGKELQRVPDDQHIIWSVPKEHTKSGLGLQQTWGEFDNVDWPTSFALHYKLPLKPHMKAEVEYCRRVRGCDAHYNVNDTLEIGCHHHNRTVLAAQKRRQ